MFITSLLTAAIHVFIVLQAVRFFRTAGSIRESDKTSVASIASLSVMFIMAIVLGWTEQLPAMYNHSLSEAMFMAYNLAVAVLFLGQLRMVTDRRSQNSCLLP